LVLCSHACGGKEEKRFLRIRMQNSSNNRQIEVLFLIYQDLEYLEILSKKVSKIFLKIF